MTDVNNDTAQPMTGVTSDADVLPPLDESITQSYDMLVQSLRQLTDGAPLTQEQLNALIAQQPSVVWEEEQVQEEGSIQPEQGQEVAQATEAQPTEAQATEAQAFEAQATEAQPPSEDQF
jgi:hypothetical protein